MNEFLKNNREILLFGGALLILISVVGFILWYTGGEEAGTQEKVDVTLNREEDSSQWNEVNIATVESGIDSEVLSVYDGRGFSVDDAEEIATNLGFSGSGTTSGEGMYRVWGNEDEFARFNTTSGDFIVNSGGISLDEMETSILSDGIEGYVQAFVRSYLGIETDIEIESTTNEEGYFVNGIWKVDEYEIVHSYGQDYSFTAEFSESGDLISLYTKGLILTKTDQSVSIVPVDTLDQYIHLDEYPKEAYLDVSSSGSTQCAEEGCSYSFEGFDDVEITRASIVYYYDSAGDSSDVVPVYRLSGPGTATDDDGESHEVTVVIYANAIDPSELTFSSDE